MSSTHGEGRASGEKSQIIWSTPEARRQRKYELEKEEADWAARSGPVEIRRIERKP